ncbi:MAG: hypothetical protein M1830_008298 [Pleopsidium flavum]|nr:MAG: hypothetical protein M1830_008298 [Pleopsidium flavum]
MSHSSSPASAPATLASSLLNTLEKLQSQQTKPNSLSTGCTAIDYAALEGGFRYGEVVALAGEGSVGRVISLHALTTHLLHNSTSPVALIDTTGSFSPLKLHDIIFSRLRSGDGPGRGAKYVQQGYMYSRVEKEHREVETGEEDSEGMEQKVKGVLERVMVMRVFDFVGVVEAVAEVGARLENRRDHGLVGLSEEEERDSAVRSAGRERRGKEGEVADSEDEESTEELDATMTNAGGGTDDDGATGGVGMIVIDSITNVVSSMMTKNQVQGLSLHSSFILHSFLSILAHSIQRCQLMFTEKDTGHALLTAFMRSLQHLTRTHNLCTLLLNAAVGVHPPDNPSYRHRPDDSSNVSIFESTAGKPALGKTFAYLIDRSLFLSKVAKGEGASNEGQNVEVLEAVKDRFGAGEGRWGAFEIVVSGNRLSVM